MPDRVSVVVALGTIHQDWLGRLLALAHWKEWGERHRSPWLTIKIEEGES